MACLPHRLRKGVNFNRMCEMFIVLRCVVFLNFSTHLICKYSMFVVFSGLNRGWFFSMLVSVAFFICIYIFKHLCVNLNILNVNVWIWVLCKVASIHQVCSRLRAQHIKSLFLCDNGVCVCWEREKEIMAHFCPRHCADIFVHFALSLSCALIKWTQVWESYQHCSSVKREYAARFKT